MSLPRIPLVAGCVGVLFISGALAQSPSASTQLAADYVPSFGDATWARRDPTAAGFDPLKLEAAIEFARTHETQRPRDFSDQQRIFGTPLGPLPARRGGTNGLILRGGAIVAEFGDTSVVEPVYSAAKSMLSTMLGLALDRGLIKDIDARVGAQVNDGGYDSPQNQAITWRHHATQSSEWEGTLFGKPHTFLGLEEFGEGARQPRALQPPGAHYEYNDVRVNRFAISLLRVWKRPLSEVFRDEVMTPIGASTTWQWIPYRDAVVHVDGRTLPTVSGGTRWGGGVWMNSRDAARFGLLFLRRGQWASRAVISPRWVRDATTPSARKDDYGFLWWLNTGQKQWPSTPASSFAAIGFGSNTIWIDPEHELVVVWRWHQGNGAEFFARVVAALKD
ncbi:MAG: serine hydrolase [Vicinamibacteria bacterium]|nr:serine hydrolase [Vicinamibacteria bacterium]